MWKNQCCLDEKEKQHQLQSKKGKCRGLAYTSRSHLQCRDGVGFAAMDPQAIYASVRWAPVVGCKIEPDRVDHPGARFQIVLRQAESLSVALLEVVGKLCQKKQLLGIKYRFSISLPSEHPWDPAVLWRAWPVVRYALFVVQLDLMYFSIKMIWRSLKAVIRLIRKNEEI